MRSPRSMARRTRGRGQGQEEGGREGGPRGCMGAAWRDGLHGWRWQSLDPEQIRQWWSRWPMANIAANPIVERMQQAKGMGKFKIWVPGIRFEPSLEHFPAAMKAFEAVCKV